MNDWKLILKVTIGCAVLLMISIWGLSKMAGPDNALKVDEKVLLEGARFVKENGETKVTVVNFSDMQCPACKVADLQTRELLNKQGVKIVVRLFPLPATLHRYALISAKAVETARIMGKGFEMMSILYDKQEEWSAVEKPEDRFAEYAKSLGLDENIFREKLGSAEVAENVQTDANLAASLQLSGTPTYFVNGEQIGSPFVVDKVKQLLGEK
ncbi:MAG: DsbA oxidoreductase [uncultured bacterium]|nr:MAG: DsbA oxidoreductase [uncultured bacterium]